MNIKFGLHAKQFIFFIVLMVVAGVLYFLIANQYIFASLSDVMEVNYSQGAYNLPMVIKSNSDVQVADTVDKKIIQSKEDYDLFRYVVFSDEGIYADNLNVEVKLPKPISSIDELKPRVYAVHGVGSTDYYLRDPQTITFTAQNLIPTSTFTIELSLPKGFVDLPWNKELVYGLSHLPILFWFIISKIPLVLTLVVLFYLYHKTSRDWLVPKTKEIRKNIPSDLNSAEASVLVNNKITSRSIASIFVDLANKGKIQIIDRGNYFTFYKTSQNVSDLKKYERILLDKVFMPQTKRATVEDVELRISRHVFSRKIAQVYLEIYKSLYDKGYFTRDPNKFQSGYARFGHAMFFVGILGFILSIIYLADIPYFLLVWFSLVTASVFVIKISPQLPLKTNYGLGKAKKWQAYKNFLKLDKPYGYSLNAQQMYERGLSYAVAFGCEREWTKRFLRYPFRLPNWFVTRKDTVLLEDILDEVVPFVYFVSHKLTEIKEPTV